MAVTIRKVLDIKGYEKPIAFPVASGETIYGGTIACVDKAGYLRNLSSTYAPQAKIIVFVADDTANSTGAAATTSAGSISGSLETGTADAGDKTIRYCYVSGRVKVTCTSITQADVGKTVFATDNYTVDEAQNSAIKIGTLVTYLSSTSGWVDLNKFYQQDGTVFYKQAITRSSGAAGLFNIANPSGATILVERLELDITAASSAAGTINVGIGATGADADTLIDGITSSLTGIFDNIIDKGTNGGLDKATSSEFITGTLSIASGALFAGSVGVWYRVWE